MSTDSRSVRHRPTAGIELDDPPIDTPEDAATAVMLTMAPTEPPQLVFLFCDDRRRVRVGVSVQGAGPADAPRAAECLMSAADDGWSTGLVVGLVLAEESTDLSVAEVGALVELSEICDDEALELLEVVAVAGSHWRSVLFLVVGNSRRRGQ